MNDFGHYSICLAWGLSLYGVHAGAFAGSRKSYRWYLSTVNASLLTTACTTIAILSLAYGFLTDDYSNQYVWQFSNRDMDPIYKVTAIWGGMDGSMLLWCFILSISGFILAYRSTDQSRTMMPWVLSVFNTSLLFFLTIVVYFTNPFRYIKAPFIPPDGRGLNPLLQNPFMAIHPPMLYLGFTTLAVPYAFCLGALLSRNLTNEWILLTRRWTLVAWAFLTAGIILGGHWAYIELGWGGFWAWDPVENASFLPWLTATAFLHSVMVQERKNMLRFWNIWLVVLTYALTVLGTFLTRSGVVQSVHAFASTDFGWVFLVYLGFVIGSTAIITFRYRAELRSENGIESFLSREAAFLVNNLLVFLSICFSILWGILFPIFSEAVTGSKQAVGIPFYDAVNIPLFLLLVFLMGVGPLVAWRKATIQSIRKTFLVPFLSALVIAVLLVFAGVTSFYPVLSYSLCFFVLMTLFGEFHRGIAAQKVSAAGKSGPIFAGASNLFRRHRVRYGGYVVHLGVVIVTIAITASMAHKVEKEFTLAKGESYEVGRFRLTLDIVGPVRTKNYESLQADVSLRSLGSGEVLTVLKPEHRFFFRNNETTTGVALRMGLREDVYLVLAGTDDSGERASFKVFINPLQVWLWFGAMVMLLGTVIVLIPHARPATVRVKEGIGIEPPVPF